MGFIKSVAKAGGFGLAGLVGSSIFKKHKNKDEAPKPSLTTGDYNSNSGSSTVPSLINSKAIY